MLLGCVLSACNLNDLYLDFVPLFIKCWNQLLPNVMVRIILVANEIPDSLKDYTDNIILFEEIDGINSAFISQYIRMLYPALINCEGGVVITDIDMLPMNAKYYTENIKDIADDKFVYYRDVLIKKEYQIAMCYNVATPKVWSDISGINNLEDVSTQLQHAWSNTSYSGTHGGSGWSKDQQDLYLRIRKWNRRTKKLVTLKDASTGFNRLDRNTFVLNDVVVDNIKKGNYSDYHVYRPYTEYREINDGIVNVLCGKDIDTNTVPQVVSNNGLNVDKIFIINLAHRTDRKTYMLDQLQQQNITNYEFFDAIKPTIDEVNEWNVDFCMYAIKGIHPSRFEGYRIGCLGCLKSHIGIMKLALARNYETVLILEDDATFVRPYSSLYSDSIQIDNSFDMLYLGGGHRNQNVPVSKNIHRVYETFTTGSYIVTKKTMQYVIDNIEGYHKEIDIFYVEKVQQDLECYTCMPSIVKQIPGYSDIQNLNVVYKVG